VRSKRSIAVAAAEVRPVPVEQGSRSRGSALNDLRIEAIALCRHGVQKTRILRIIFQSQANLADRGIDGIVRIDKDMLTPYAIKDFPPRHQLTTTFNQQKQQFQGNALEADHMAPSA
jgi:hypothetical protein